MCYIVSMFIVYLVDVLVYVDAMQHVMLTHYIIPYYTTMYSTVIGLQQQPATDSPTLPDTTR